MRIDHSITRLCVAERYKKTALLRNASYPDGVDGTAGYAGISTNQTVLTEVSPQTKSAVSSVDSPAHSAPPPPPPPHPPRRGWVAAAAFALTASVGGVYFIRKLNTLEEQPLTEKTIVEVTEKDDPPIPASPEGLPQHVDYLVVGAGTAAFAALRAIRSLRPDARVLLVGDELALPYMRPPLTKELWGEPDLAKKAVDPDTLIFTQWNGKKRRLAYEPSVFYTPTEKLREGAAGAGVARGWSVRALDVGAHEAQLGAAGHTATLTYGKCLIATGVRSARCPALRGGREAGLVLGVRTAREAARLAERVARAPAGEVAVVGGGAYACELAAGLAHALRETDKSVVMVYKEEVPLAQLLPRHLALDAARRLRRLGVRLLPHTEVTDSSVSSDRVRLQLARLAGEDGQGEELVTERGAERTLEAGVVVECVGSEPNVEVARAAGLEVHPELGGVVVNAEMQARTDVFAAGDVACYFEPALGRRRALRHDHAVASGRLAGTNMVGDSPRAYTHQPMFWSDIGPDIGIERGGLTGKEAGGDSGRGGGGGGGPACGGRGRGRGGGGGGAGAGERHYERGVVFYMREERVVGVLLWNLFNRMHVARQVLKQGHFEDLLEAAKLFSLHEPE
ncbi:Putative apoptosis-inducing factor 1, mitochondrial [Papilio machaon]|uniref:Putative apoptosis-inducing factor 1, mitochondrial n=1 Tax=Papilio machaon TaxID=76193 RepID=A0A0N1PH97_PAPMA|nr:Putative apoptosis-inducing factor 1, mitochondrial [Papilio machaon]